VETSGETTGVRSMQGMKTIANYDLETKVGYQPIIPIQTSEVCSEGIKKYVK
jgi:hypothetical protein